MYMLELQVNSKLDDESNSVQTNVDDQNQENTVSRSISTPEIVERPPSQ